MIDCYSCGKRLSETCGVTTSGYTQRMDNPVVSTGYIYYCPDCKAYTLDDFLSGETSEYIY